MFKLPTYILITLLLISCNSKNDKLRITFTGDDVINKGIDCINNLINDTLLNVQTGNYSRQDFLMLLEKGSISPLNLTNKPQIVQNGSNKCAVISVELSADNGLPLVSETNKLKTIVEGIVKALREVPLILYINWNLELNPSPDIWQKELAADLINLGVDVIVGHHSHIAQSLEFINNKPVFYSLGGSEITKSDKYSDIRYALEIEIQDTIFNYSIMPYGIDKYFHKPPTLKKELAYLKHHIKKSDISIYERGLKWNVKQVNNTDFSECSNLWMISDNNTLSIIKKLNNNSYLLKFQKDKVSSNIVNLHGKLSEFQVADINNDNNLDVIVGISKKVKFDPYVKKRINIYTFVGGALKPLWLGTKFINDIHSFDIEKSSGENCLKTTEIKRDGTLVERVYEWNDFGFALTK